MSVLDVEYRMEDVLDLDGWSFEAQRDLVDRIDAETFAAPDFVGASNTAGKFGTVTVDYQITSIDKFVVENTVDVIEDYFGATVDNWSVKPGDRIKVMGTAKYPEEGRVSRQIQGAIDQRVEAQAGGGGEISTVSDVPNEGYTLVTGAHEREHVLESIGEPPGDWDHGGLFVKTGGGEYTDVIFFPGNVPYLNKGATRIK